MAAFGALTLLGWLTGQQALTSPLPGQTSTKANTAFALVTAGLALALASRDRRSRWPAGLAMLTLAVAGLTLLQYVSGVDLGFDELIARDEDAASGAPGRMSPPSAVALVACALGLLAGRRTTPRAGAAREGLGALALLAALLALSAHAYGAVLLGDATQMSVPTGAAVLVLAVGVTLLGAEGPLARLLRDPGPTGEVSRRLLPAAIAVPLVVGFLRIEMQQRGLVGTELGATIYAIAMVAVLGAGALMILLRLQSAQAQRDRAEDERRETIRRTDLAEQAMGRGTWQWDVTKDRAVWSPGMYRLFGLDPATFHNTNENFLALVHPDDRGRLLKAMESALANPGRFEQEYRLQRPDGHLIQVRGEGNVVPGQDGRPQSLFGFVQDVTHLHEMELARAQAEAAVEASESRLRAVLDNASDAIITGDATATIVGWNRAAERIFGLSAPQATGRSIGSLLPAAQWADYQADIAAFMQGKPSKYVGRPREMQGLRSDGTEIDIELSLAVWQSGTGPMFTGVVRDITERKQAQDAVRRAQDRFATVFQLSPVPISLTKDDGTFVDANEAFATLTGHSREALLQGPVRAPDLWEDPDERKRMLAGLRERGLVRDLEVRVRRADGQVRTTLANLEFVDLGGGTTILTLLQDITERKRLEEERAARIESEAELERLRRTDRFRADFINNIAHELATPLTPLVLKVKTLAADKSLTPTQRTHVETVERNVQRLRHLVDDMVGAADLQARNLALDKRRLNLTRELRAAVAAYQPVAERAGITMDEPEDTGLTVSADPARLQLVLGHLLGNAVKFTSAQGRVSVTSRRVGEDVRIEVKDTGAGLTPKQMEGLWRPFAQAHDKSQRTNSGSGLGLYVTKGIVELHGGEVGCSSPGPGQGATFWFTLPLAAGHVDPLARPRVTAAAAPEPRRNLNPGVSDDA